MANKYSVGINIQAFDEATKAIKKVQRALGELNRSTSFSKLKASISSVKSAFGDVIQEGGLFVTRMGALAAAGVGLFAAFLKPAMAMEELRFRLTQLYGSAAKGKQMFNWITDFAKKSPYGIETITQSLLKFKGQGFDNLEQFKNILNYFAVYVPDQFKAGDAIMQLSQAWGKAKLQGEDLRAVINAGVPVWQLLGKVTGKNVAQLQKMGEKSQITRSLMMKMFQEMGRQSQGAGAAIFDLWSTKISNLGDMWTVFADRVMNLKLGDLSLSGEMKADLTKLSDFLNTGLDPKNLKKTAAVLSDVYHTAKELATALIPLIPELVNLAKAFSKLVGGTSNAIKVLIAIMASPFVASIITVISTIAGAISWFFSIINISEIAWAALGVGIAIWEGLAAAITLLSNPIGWIIAAILALGFAAHKLIENWKPVSEFFANMWQGIADGARNAFNSIRTFISMVPNTGGLFPAPKMALAYAGGGGGNGFMRGKKDTLDLGIKVDILNNRASVTNAQSRGDSTLKFKTDMGIMTGWG